MDTLGKTFGVYIISINGIGPLHIWDYELNLLYPSTSWSSVDMAERDIWPAGAPFAGRFSTLPGPAQLSLLPWHLPTFLCEQGDFHVDHEICRSMLPLKGMMFARKMLALCRIVEQIKPGQKPYWLNPPALKCAATSFSRRPRVVIQLL